MEDSLIIRLAKEAGFYITTYANGSPKVIGDVNDVYHELECFSALVLQSQGGEPVAYCQPGKYHTAVDATHLKNWSACWRAIYSQPLYASPPPPAEQVQGNDGRDARIMELEELLRHGEQT